MESRFGLSELYSPQRMKPVAHVVFVHGLFGHPRKTWTAATPEEKTGGEKEQDHAGEKSTEHSAHGDGVFWPKTLLPAVIPDAKILTFGYDANVGGFLSSTSQNTIHQHAENLLSDLADLRDTPAEQSIPLIFVVHSLGGLIVKDAINQSVSTVGTRLKAIAPATFGICFLGTPHRGSKTASLGKIAWNCTAIATNRPNLKLLQALERNSEVLDRIGDNFSQTLLKHDIAVYSFREEQETRKFWVFNTMVVDADSAKIGDGKEEVGSIPANHGNMIKFPRASNIGFRRVSAQIRRWLENIRGEDVTLLVKDHIECLNSLDDLATRSRIIEVHPAHEKTFHWLFDPTSVTFADWLRNTKLGESPIYWIQGKPGSGKSTLMKFAMHDPRLLEFLGSRTEENIKLQAAGTSSVDPDVRSSHSRIDELTWTVAAFFFHDRGSQMQRTLTGMLQQILYSILGQVPALFNCVMPLFTELAQTQRSRKPEWDSEHLQSALISIVSQREVRVRILFLVDALDEHSGDNEQLASLLEKLIKKADNDYVGIKMCLASRSWTIFEEHFGSCPGFAIHDYTKRDIFNYVTSRLRLESQVMQSAKGLTAVIELVTERALGVFIWVRLVVDLLVKGIRDGTPLTTLEVIARDLPQELKELYAHTLERIEPGYVTEAYIMLQIALCTLVPLPLESFMCSVDYNYRDLLQSSRPQQQRLGDLNLKDSISSPARRLASRCGGLLEIVSIPPPEGAEAKEPESVVQFIHQTVKEYVNGHQQDLGLRKVLPIALEEDGHVFLLRACAESKESWVCCIKKDLFEYAKHVDDLESDLESGSVSNKHPRVNFLLSQVFDTQGEFDVKWWLREREGHFFKALETSLLGYRSHQASNPLTNKVPEVIMLKLAVAANLLSVLATDNLPSNDADQRFEGYGNLDLLHIAAAGPDIITSSRNVDVCRMVKLLLHKGCAVEHSSTWYKDYILNATVGRVLVYKIRSQGPVTPLEALLLTDQAFSSRNEETQLSIARTLLQKGYSANNKISFRPNGSTRLDFVPIVEFCVRYKSAHLVRLLVEYGATLSLDLLDFAHFRHDQEVIRALLDNGIKTWVEIGDFKISSLPRALVATSRMLAAPSGGAPISSDGLHSVL